MKIMLAMNARDELHILEWVIHHMRFGFDKILIWDHRSQTPISGLVPARESITIFRREEECVCKHDLMLESKAYAEHAEMDWMMYLDADEFLVLPPNLSIHGFIAEREQQADQIVLNWLLFGSSHHDRHPRGETILSTYVWSSTHFDQHVKSIVRVQSAIAPINPHVWRLKEGGRQMAMNEEPVSIETPYFHTNPMSLEENPAFVAHYLYQAYETYMDRKIRICRDDAPNSFRVMESSEIIHSRFNDQETTLVRDRYDQENRERMENGMSRS